MAAPFAASAFGARAQVVGSVPPSPAQVAASSGDLKVTALRGGVQLISGGGTNVVAMRGPEGAVMINGGLPQFAEAMAEKVKSATRTQKIAALANTQWRPEYTGANDLLGQAGATIIAQEQTKQWMRNAFSVRWENFKDYKPRAMVARPTKVFVDKEVLSLGRETCEFGWLVQGSTDGDCYAYFKDANVLVAGGVLANGAWPTVDYSTGGWSAGMMWALETIMGVTNDDTIIVPSIGPVMTRKQVRDHHIVYSTVFDRLRTLMEAGTTVAQVIEKNPAKEWEAERGSPALYLEQGYESFWGHIRQFNVA